MDKVLLVGIGGFIGATLRYFIGSLVHRCIDAARFPYGTLTVNLVGCLAIGFLAGLVETRGILTPESRAFAFIGILGAFTTFSTFGYETISFLRDGPYLRLLTLAYMSCWALLLSGLVMRYPE